MLVHDDVHGMMMSVECRYCMYGQGQVGSNTRPDPISPNQQKLINHIKGSVRTVGHQEISGATLNKSVGSVVGPKNELVKTAKN
mmetsp:Transcript_19262/g.43873  ORF Transcript_19262/g.43873 Transcript_19262/m.43873 type:complete len:84 (+) Transcript_19262:394-645(+)